MPEPPRGDRSRGILFAVLGLLAAVVAVLAVLLIVRAGDADSGNAKTDPSTSSRSGSVSSAGPSPTAPGTSTSPSAPGTPASTSAPGTPASTSAPTAASATNEVEPAAGISVAEACQNAAGASATKVSTNTSVGADSGYPVLVLTTLLSAAGYLAEPDSDFGSVDESALMDFQADYGLFADGIAGPLTWPVLIQVTCSD